MLVADGVDYRAGRRLRIHCGSRWNRHRWTWQATGNRFGYRSASNGPPSILDPACSHFVVWSSSATWSSVLENCDKSTRLDASNPGFSDDSIILFLTATGSLINAFCLRIRQLDQTPPADDCNNSIEPFLPATSCSYAVGLHLHITTSTTNLHTVTTT